MLLVQKRIVLTTVAVVIAINLWGAARFTYLLDRFQLPLGEASVTVYEGGDRLSSVPVKKHANERVVNTERRVQVYLNKNYSHSKNWEPSMYTLLVIFIGAALFQAFPKTSGSEKQI